MEVAVDAILDYMPINAKPYFLVKWVNLSHEYNSWESLDQLQPILDQIQLYFDTQSKHKLIQNQIKKRKKTELSFKKEKKCTEKQKSAMEVEPIDLDENTNTFQLIPNKTSKISRILQKRKQAQQKIQSIQQSSMDMGFDEKKRDLKLEDKNTQQTQADQNEREESSWGANFDIIGTIVREDIQTILKCFTWKEVQCVSIRLKNGNTVNMQRADLALVHPQMLIEFCETHNLIF